MFFFVEYKLSLINGKLEYDYVVKFVQCIENM